ncbi:DUF1290 domain-containing protein [Jeotgalibacillus proteolyticus]|uniref:DUF1290 domain-containing protein n=1 Tax=Jeotgalibacillus proteolyticus TaxID=2082395 RepID=UPI003CF25714
MAAEQDDQVFIDRIFLKIILAASLAFLAVHLGVDLLVTAIFTFRVWFTAYCCFLLNAFHISGQEETFNRYRFLKPKGFLAE